MSKDLTNSALDRQNILNNSYAIREIENATHITGIPFEGKTVVLKEQVADFFEVTLRTVENYLSQFEEELVRNGYEVIKGIRLKSFKSVLQEMDVPEIYFGNIAKTPQLGILDFRAFLNLAMLMVESERARLLQQAILDIVIDTINQRTGGGTKSMKWTRSRSSLKSLRRYLRMKRSGNVEFGRKAMTTKKNSCPQIQIWQVSIKHSKEPLNQRIHWHVKPRPLAMWSRMARSWILPDENQSRLKLICVPLERRPKQVTSKPAMTRKKATTLKEEKR